MSYEEGKLLIKKKYFKQALKYFNKLLEYKPSDLRANFQMGKIYYELNDLHNSFSFFNKCKNIKPNDPNILFNYALVLQNIGKIKNAEKEYINLIALNPNDIKSYYGLSTLNINNINLKFYNKLKSLNENNDTTIFGKSLINFIFSKLEKKNNNLENEINYLKLSHKLCYKAFQNFNSQSNFYYKQIIAKKFNQIKFDGNFKAIDQFNNNNHIFIIGLPRSGSTLVETIISHNSRNISSVGEFHGINTSILDQISSIIFSKSLDLKNFELKINQKEFQEALIEKYDNFKNKIYLDKSLENFFNIELILKFFPNAKFIHTFRDLNDAIIGIYQTMLPELSWCHKIQDIKEYIEIYKSTIKYFKTKYPDKILDIDLSKLTTEKESEARKILDFCEIEYKDNFLDFENNEDLYNKTNSFLQVREKIQTYNNNKYKSYYYLLS